MLYRLRLFLRVLRVFGLRKRWVLLWLAADWLTLLIFATRKRIQPIEGIRLGEDWEAGTVPADIPLSAAQHGGAAEAGLSVNLRERSVKDVFKTRYLLKDISLHIPNGSLVLLLGGSGSGKTTLVNAIIGYEQADATILPEAPGKPPMLTIMALAAKIAEML